jgi:Zn-dependent protease/CBS domain-containing protein
MARRGDGPFHASVPLGRLAGVPVGLHWSWFAALALFSWSLGATVFPAEHPGLADATYAGMAIVAALALFACLIAHELGHALQARREGVEIEGITLWVFGGVARFKGMFPSAGAELRIAIAGPLVSLALGLALAGAAAMLSLPDAIEGVVAWLGWVNLMLLGFNLLPALPLDGGRVLRALLWRRSGDFARATRTAGRLGRIIGHVMATGGLVLVLFSYPSGFWLAMVGFFIVLAAGAESRLAEASVLLGGLTVADAMAPDPVAVPADADLAWFADAVYARARHTAYPVVETGRAAGRLTFRAVADVPAASRHAVRVRDVAQPLDRTLVLTAREPLFEATLQLLQHPDGWAVVTDGGDLAGVLTISDVSRVIELRRLTATVRSGPRPDGRLARG